MEPVSVEISTKGRYQELAQCLLSLVTQTYSPKEIIVFDDNENPQDLRLNPVYQNIFNLLNRKGIQWSILLSGGVGQLKNHQAAITISKYPLLFRCDDDTFLEPDCLQHLVSVASKDPMVGAVGPSVLHPDIFFEPECVSPFIADCVAKYAQQFLHFSWNVEVEHLYSTFLINKSAVKHKYNSELSKVAHTEETQFSHEIFRNGYKLIACGDAVVWHLKAPTGGIRSFKDPGLWQHDQRIFEAKLAEWGVNVNQYKVIYLNNGIGDHFCFKKILPEIHTKYPNHKLIISACYPEVFDDVNDYEIASLNAGRILLSGNIDKYDVYKYCSDNNWQGHLIDAFRAIYLNE